MATIVKTLLGFLLPAWAWVLRGGWKWLVVPVLALLAWFAWDRVHDSRVAVATAVEAQRAAEGEAELLREARPVDEAAVEEVANIRADIAADDVKTNIKVEKAIAKNPDWSKQRIPADVLSVLRD